MKAKVIRYITHEIPDIPYKGEVGVAYPYANDKYWIKFDNQKLGSGWFYNHEIQLLNI